MTADTGTVRYGNDRLRTLMREHRVSRKALARRVREAASRHGDPVSCDHTSVARWLAGTMPRRQTRSYIAEALTVLIGRPVSLPEVGMSIEDGPAVTLGAPVGREAADSDVREQLARLAAQVETLTALLRRLDPAASAA